MRLSKEQFDNEYNELPEQLKREALNYIQYLMQRNSSESLEDVYVYDDLLKCAGKITKEQADRMLADVKSSREEWDV